MEFSLKEFLTYRLLLIAFYPENPIRGLDKFSLI